MGQNDGTVRPGHGTPAEFAEAAEALETQWHDLARGKFLMALVEGKTLPAACAAAGWDYDTFATWRLMAVSRIDHPEMNSLREFFLVYIPLLRTSADLRRLDEAREFLQELGDWRADPEVVRPSKLASYYLRGQGPSANGEVSADASQLAQELARLSPEQAEVYLASFLAERRAALGEDIL